MALRTRGGGSQPGALPMATHARFHSHRGSPACVDLFPAPMALRTGKACRNVQGMMETHMVRQTRPGIPGTLRSLKKGAVQKGQSLGLRHGHPVTIQALPFGWHSRAVVVHHARMALGAGKSQAVPMKGMPERHLRPRPFRFPKNWAPPQIHSHETRQQGGHPDRRMAQQGGEKTHWQKLTRLPPVHDRRPNM